MFRLKVARSAAEIEELSSVWDSLLAPELSLFQSYRWNHLAAQAFASREQPHFIFAESGCGAAIIPAVIDKQSRTIRFAGERLFDYRDYLAQGDQAALTGAWQQLPVLNLPLSVTSVCRPESEVWRRLPKTFFSRAPRLVNNATAAEQFEQQHSRAFSRFRRLERMGLRIAQYRGDSAIVRHIYELRARQSAEGELFHDPLRVDFMVAVCREEGSACEVFTLEHGSTLAAALVTFRDHGIRRFYTACYHRGWARYSPGASLLFEIARRSLAQELSCDLMTGEQAYKMRIARDAQDLFQVQATAQELQELVSRQTTLERAA